MKYFNFKYSKIKLIIIASFIITITLIGSVYIYNKVSSLAIQGWSQKVVPSEDYKNIDDKIKNQFSIKNEKPTLNRYKALFKYFAHGFNSYKSENSALVYYPGEISTRGRKINALEGFARFFPLAASWLSSGNTRNLKFDEVNFDIVDSFKAGLLSGTNQKSNEYWGDIEDKDQRIVEAADIALGIWISKDFIWKEFSIIEKKQIVFWLKQAMYKNIVDNNWNLFPITIGKVLESLGYSNEADKTYIKNVYNQYKKNHYIGNGWFDDPPKGIDYYNAWSIHYSLFWIDQIDPNFDPIFIRKSHSEFLKFYKYFFSENGFPIMGRSVCYRLAAPSPIISGTLLAPNDISPGFALRSLDLTWKYFIKNNALEYGKVTQGYFEDNLSVLDAYSGAGSCLWSLRSLVMAFYVDKYVSLWDSVQEELPIEISDFSITNSQIGWTIKGNKIKKSISLEIHKNKNNKIYYINKYGYKNEFKEIILKRPFRPNNSHALYKNPIYTNDFYNLLNK